MGTLVHRAGRPQMVYADCRCRRHRCETEVTAVELPANWRCRAPPSAESEAAPGSAERSIKQAGVTQSARRHRPGGPGRSAQPNVFQLGHHSIEALAVEPAMTYYGAQTRPIQKLRAGRR